MNREAEKDYLHLDIGAKLRCKERVAMSYLEMTLPQDYYIEVGTMVEIVEKEEYPTCTWYMIHDLSPVDDFQIGVWEDKNYLSTGEDGPFSKYFEVVEE